MTDPTRAEVRTAICARLGRVLGGLAPDADALAGEAGERFLAGGDELFREGDPGDAAYLILSGRLRAVRQASDGERADAGRTRQGVGRQGHVDHSRSGGVSRRRCGTSRRPRGVSTWRVSRVYKLISAFGIEQERD